MNIWQQKQVLSIVKWSLALLAWVFIIWYFFERPDLIFQIKGELILFISSNFLSFLFLLCLGGLNWLLEAIKWKVIVERFETITLPHALRSVLVGLAIGFIIPRSLGDISGRVILLKDKYKAASGLLLNRIIQYAITVFFGIVGIVLLKKQFIDINYLQYILIGLLLLCVATFVFRKKLVILLNKPFINKFKIILSSRDWQVVAFGLLRYAVFTLCYFILLVNYNQNISWVQIMSGIAVLYLLKSTVFSTNFLGDLGVRESLALLIFTSIGFKDEQVLSAGLINWIINILLPSMVGSVLILQRRK